MGGRSSDFAGIKQGHRQGHGVDKSNCRASVRVDPGTAPGDAVHEKIAGKLDGCCEAALFGATGDFPLRCGPGERHRAADRTIGHWAGADRQGQDRRARIEARAGILLSDRLFERSDRAFPLKATFIAGPATPKGASCDRDAREFDAAGRSRQVVGSRDLRGASRPSEACAPEVTDGWWVSKRTRGMNSKRWTDKPPGQSPASSRGQRMLFIAPSATRRAKTPGSSQASHGGQ